MDKRMLQCFAICVCVNGYVGKCIAAAAVLIRMRSSRCRDLDLWRAIVRWSGRRRHKWHRVGRWTARLLHGVIASERNVERKTLCNFVEIYSHKSIAGQLLKARTSFHAPPTIQRQRNETRRFAKLLGLSSLTFPSCAHLHHTSTISSAIHHATPRPAARRSASIDSQ